MLKTFSLLWLNGAGGNQEMKTTKAKDSAEAAAFFGLASDYVKHENGGAWCVAENFQSF